MGYYTEAEASAFAELWPKPNWKELSSQMPRDQLAFACSLYQTLPRSPHLFDNRDIDGHVVTRDEWQSAYFAAITLIADLILTRTYPEDEFLLSLKSDFDAQLLKNGYYYVLACGHLRPDGFISHSLDLSPLALDLNQLLLRLDFPGRIDPDKVRFLPRLVRATQHGSTFYAICDRYSGEPVTEDFGYENRFQFYDDALAALLMFHEHEFARDESIGSAIAPVVDRGVSVFDGTIYPSGGIGISPDQIARVYKLRSLEINERLSREQVRVFLANLNDSFSHFCDLLNIPPAWVGAGALNVRICQNNSKGIMFYPDELAITLSLHEGIGEIAKQCFMYLDYRMGRKWAGKPDFYSSLAESTSGEGGGEKAFCEILSVVKAQEHYVGDSKALDDGGWVIKTPTGGWSGSPELMSRAFSAFVEDKLIEKGIKDHWLSARTNYRDHQVSQPYPYPMDEERRVINNAFSQNLPKIFAVQG